MRLEDAKVGMAVVFRGNGGPDWGTVTGITDDGMVLFKDEHSKRSGRPVRPEDLEPYTVSR